MGYSHTLALGVWVEDTRLEEVRQLAAAIFQAERLGTSLARALCKPRSSASSLRSSSPCPLSCSSTSRRQSCCCWCG